MTHGEAKLYWARWSADRVPTREEETLQLQYGARSDQ